ncbi:MAG: hypothetical protein QG552_2231 [Thermodesulfobacteriota bacterium]|nr:hypothetical protein [Thermodesulfobacteriota bacterium]
MPDESPRLCGKPLCAAGQRILFEIDLDSPPVASKTHRIYIPAINLPHPLVSMDVRSEFRSTLIGPVKEKHASCILIQ